MAENNNSEDIILNIEVKYEDAIGGIAKYQREIDLVRASQSKLKQELKDGKITQDQYNRSMAASKAQIDAAKKAQRLLHREIQNNITAQTKNEDSLRSLRAQLSNTTKDFDDLSRAEREGAKGTELLEKIKALQEELRGAEEASGRFQRNVGNYQSINKGLLDGLKQINPQLGALLEKLQASPAFAEKFGKANEFLTQKLKLSASAATALQFAVAGLVVLGIALAIKAYQEWTKEQERQLKTQKEFGDKTGEILGGVIVTVKKLRNEWLALGNDFKKKQEFVEKNKTEFDKLGVSIQNVNDAENILVKSTSQFIQAMELRAKANASYEIASEKYKEYAKKVQEAKNALESAPSFADKWNAEVSQFNAGFSRLFKPLGMIEKKWDVAEGYKNKRVESLTQEAKEIDKVANSYLNSYADLSKQADELLNNIGIKATQDTSTIFSIDEKRLLQDLAKYKVDTEAQTQKTIATDNEKSYQERLNATYLYYQQQLLSQKIEDEILLSQEGLSATQKELIKAKSNQRLIDLQKELNDSTLQLMKDEDAKQVGAFKTNLDNKLATVKQGSDAELELKLQQLALQEQAEIESAERTGADIALIREKYRQLEIQEQEKQDAYLTSQKQKEFQNRILEAELEGQNTLAIKIEQKMAELEALKQLEGESDLDYYNRKLQLQNELKGIEDDYLNYQLETRTQVMQATSVIAGGFQELFESMAEDNAAFAGFAKAMALYQIGVDTATALTAGVKQAQSVPFPGNIAAIATTVATILSNIAKAKKYLTASKEPKAPKFNQGGLVTGEGSGTSDSIRAYLSNGESVMTARTTAMFSPILSAFNQIGGGVPISTQDTSNQVMGEEMLSRAFAKAVLGIPNPVVSVQEIDNVTNRIGVLEASINI